jgi:hypothetical protein
MFLGAVLLLAACAKREPIVTSGAVDPSLARALRADGVSVAPVVVMSDLPAAPIPRSPVMGEIEARLREGEEHLPAPSLLDPDVPRDAAFLRNEYVGNVRFGGGFVRTGDVALEVRARLIELGQEERYREDAVRWLGEMVPRALGELGVPVGPPAAPVTAAPERRRTRGLHPEDGHDNINLPRVDLVPAALTAEDRAANAAYRWVVVPWLKLYYSHNGGWFLGQSFGCTAGARVEAMIAVYDTSSGRPVWWMTAEGRHIQPQKGQPSTAELEQYLIWAEGYAEERLTRGWLK